MKTLKNSLPMPSKPFSLAARAHSFRFAWAGLKAALRTEHNTRVHLAFTIATLGLGLFFNITALEACLLLLAMALVWMAELLNTAIEKTADLITLERHPQIKRIKDISAAAVLIAAVAALLVGSFIFIPKLF